MIKETLIAPMGRSNIFTDLSLKRLSEILVANGWAFLMELPGVVVFDRTVSGYYQAYVVNHV